jgi:hypothetical protein
MPTTYRISIKVLKERDVYKYRIEKVIRMKQFRLNTRELTLALWDRLCKLLEGLKEVD